MRLRNADFPESATCGIGRRNGQMTMQYVSTRGEAPDSDFPTRSLPGLRATAGSMCRSDWPQFSAAEIRAMRGLPYPDLAIRLLTPFLGGEIDACRLRAAGARSLRDVPPRRRLPAGADRRQHLRPRAVPRPDAGLQGCGDAASGAADGPCAGRARRSARRSSAPPRATPAARRSTPSPGATAPTSSSCFRTARFRRCSSGR